MVGEKEGRGTVLMSASFSARNSSISLKINNLIRSPSLSKRVLADGARDTPLFTGFKPLILRGVIVPWCLLANLVSRTLSVRFL